MTERALWVNVSGDERPEWVYVIVRFKDGRPDWSVQPRWATEGDVLAKEHSASQPAPTQECGF